jgi:hypothetical protein
MRPDQVGESLSWPRRAVPSAPPQLRCPAFGLERDFPAYLESEGSSRLSLHVWAFCYNQRHLVPYFAAHYRRFATRITVCDNYSNDGSREWLLDNGIVIVDDAGQRKMDDRILKEQKNSLWKASRGQAEWVVVCDIDEFVYVSNLQRRLAWCVEHGISCVKLTGFSMVSDQLPAHAGQIYDHPAFQVGAPNPDFYDKIALFRPDLIDEVGYGEGAHAATPEGRGLLYGLDGQFALLHYKHLGGPERLARRFQECAKNLSEANIAAGWSRHYLADKSHIEEWIDVLKTRAHRLFPPLAELDGRQAP